MRILLQLLIVAVALSPTPAFSETSASDTASARQFFQSIYRHYGKTGKGIDPLSSAGARIFDASFRALLRADARAAGPGYVGVVDFDPLCACQDWDDMHDLSIALHSGVGGATTADVSFVMGNGPDAHRHIQFDLLRVAGGWRIHNVIDRTNSAQPFDVGASIQRELDKQKRHTPANVRNK